MTALNYYIVHSLEKWIRQGKDLGQQRRLGIM